MNAGGLHAGRGGGIQRQPRQRRRAHPGGGGGVVGSSGRSDYRTRSALQGRLEEINLMVLHADGSNSYQNMTLRALYNYVMKAITSRPAGAPPCPPAMTPTSASDVLAQPSSKSPVSRPRPLLVPDLTLRSEELSSHQHSSSLSGSVRRERTRSVAAESEIRASLPPPPPPLFGTEAPAGTSGNERDRTPAAGTQRVRGGLAETSTSCAGGHGQRVSFLSPPTHRDSIIPPPLAPMDRRTATAGVLPHSSPAETSPGGSSVHTGSGGADGGGAGGGSGGAPPQHVTYRERLGGYLHPRDMRRLVTPFSSSNAPELMVRRHVMLLNFDPLRAIVLRDRLLVIVPTGADSILMNLEQRLRGGLDEVENEVFGDQEEEQRDTVVEYKDGPLEVLTMDSPLDQDAVSKEKLEDDSAKKADKFVLDDLPRLSGGKDVPKSARSVADNAEIPPKLVLQSPNNGNFKEQGAKGDDLCKTDRTTIDETEREGEGKGEEGNSPSSDSSTEQSSEYDMEADEWEDIEGKNWIEMPFELQAVDAVLSSACSMLADEACELEKEVREAMASLRGERRGSSSRSGAGQGGRWTTRRPKPGEHAQERLRVQKDRVGEMEARVQGFVRAMNLTLDEDEDMALMNLSRLLTHPERFIQPVSQDILEEESDEPELILEGYLQQALSTVNALQLLKGQITSTEELVNMMLDTVRNRLLYINTFLSLVTLCVTVGSFVGSIFGMNLLNGLEEDDDAFRHVVVGTCVGGFVMLVAMAFAFNMAMSVNNFTH